MSGTHTPGPWSVAKGDGYFVVETRTAGIKFIAQGESEAGDLANARRIVACVNACEGLTTEALERLGTLDRARVQLDVVRVEALRQRDELLEALQIARDHIEMGALEVSHCRDAALIRAAIAKATGERNGS